MVGSLQRLHGLLQRPQELRRVRGAEEQPRPASYGTLATRRDVHTARAQLGDERSLPGLQGLGLGLGLGSP